MKKAKPLSAAATTDREKEDLDSSIVNIDLTCSTRYTDKNSTGSDFVRKSRMFNISEMTPISKLARDK